MIDVSPACVATLSVYETLLSQGHGRRSSRLSSVPMFNYQVSINTLRSQGAAAITHGPVSGSTAQRATQRRLHVQMRVHIHIPHDRSGTSTRESAYTSTHMSHLPVYETPLSQGRTRAYTSMHTSHPAAPATAPSLVQVYQSGHVHAHCGPPPARRRPRHGAPCRPNCH